MSGSDEGGQLSLTVVANEGDHIGTEDGRWEIVYPDDPDDMMRLEPVEGDVEELYIATLTDFQNWRSQLDEFHWYRESADLSLEADDEDDDE